MTFTITPDTAVASVAQHIIDNHSRQRAASLLSDLYEKQVILMIEAFQANDTVAALKHAENIADMELITKAHDIRRDMHVSRLRTMPYRG
jgi:non-homologous end joining protein Ku